MTTKPPTSRQKSAARLAAVQGVYQLLLTDQSILDVFHNITEQPFVADDKNVVIEPPSHDLLRSILQGVGKTHTDLAPVIGNHLKGGRDLDSLRDQEPLLYAIVLCGAYELMAHTEIDAPIILNDYIEIGRSFFDGNEPQLINGLLDAMRGLYRPGAAAKAT